MAELLKGGNLYLGVQVIKGLRSQRRRHRYFPVSYIFLFHTEILRLHYASASPLCQPMKFANVPSEDDAMLVDRNAPASTAVQRGNSMQVNLGRQPWSEGKDGKGRKGAFCHGERLRGGWFQRQAGGSERMGWDPAICHIPVLVSEWDRAVFGCLHLLDYAPFPESAQNRVDLSGLL